VFDGGDGAEGRPAGGKDVGFGGDHDAVHGAEDELWGLRRSVVVRDVGICGMGWVRK